MRWVWLILAISLAGCDEVKVQQTDENPTCFSTSMISGDTPDGSILTNGCTGQTWMLVRGRIDDKGDSFTYYWMKLDRFDNLTPSLSRN
jgi:hypothetical protein